MKIFILHFLLCFILGHTFNSIQAEESSAPPPPQKGLTAMQIGGRLVYDVMETRGKEACKAVLNTPCTHILKNEGNADIDSKVPLSAVYTFVPDRSSHVQSTSFDFKREALAVFLSIQECTELDKAKDQKPCAEAPCTAPQRGPCYTRLKEVNAEEYSHALKLQLEKKYSEDGWYTTLLGQVALADAISADGKVGKIQDGGPLMGFFILLGVLVFGGAALGGGYYLLKMRGISLGSEGEHLLPHSSKPKAVQLAVNRGRAAASTGPGFINAGDAGAAEELKNKLSRLREQRAKELNAHD